MKFMLILGLAIIGSVLAMPVADVKEPVKEDVPLVIADYSSVSQDGKSALETEQPSSTALPAEAPTEAPRKPEEPKLPAAPSSSSEESSEEKLPEKTLTADLPAKESEKKIDLIEAAKKPAALAEESSSAPLNLNAPAEPIKDAVPALKASEDKLKTELPSKVEKPAEPLDSARKEEAPAKASEPEKTKPELDNQLVAAEKSIAPEQPKSVLPEVETKLPEKLPSEPVADLKKSEEVPSKPISEEKLPESPVKPKDATLKKEEVQAAPSETNERVVRDAQETKPAEDKKELAKDALPAAADVEKKPLEEKKPLPAADLPKPAEKEELKEEIRAEKKELLSEQKPSEVPAAVPIPEQKAVSEKLPTVKLEKPVELPAQPEQKPAEPLKDEKLEEKPSELPPAAAAAAAAESAAVAAPSKSESS